MHVVVVCVRVCGGVCVHVVVVCVRVCGGVCVSMYICVTVHQCQVALSVTPSLPPPTHNTVCECSCTWLQ